MTLFKNNHGAHAPHPRMDTTLCGDALGGDPKNDLSECKTVRGDRITCPTCIEMVRIGYDLTLEQRKFTPKQKEQAAKALRITMWGEVAAQAHDAIINSKVEIEVLLKELAKVGLAIQPIGSYGEIQRIAAESAASFKAAIQPIEKEEK